MTLVICTIYIRFDGSYKQSERVKNTKRFTYNYLVQKVKNALSEVDHV